jgi:hypothetical protein
MDTSAIVALIAGGVVLLVVFLVLIFRGGGKKAKGPRTCEQCRRAMLPAWDRCMFCGWAPAARLQFILGPLAGQTISLTEELTTLGSVAGNTVVLADPAVSRKHAGIRRVDATYELADFGSTNGVYVNGHKMPKKTLQSGDILRIGNTEMVFRRE